MNKFYEKTVLKIKNLEVTWETVAGKVAEVCESVIIEHKNKRK